jgi:hypothetical protein
MFFYRAIEGMSAILTLMDDMGSFVCIRRRLLFETCRDNLTTSSLQEFQAAHERIFKAMDINKDGKLSLEEMQAFMHGTR